MSSGVAVDRHARRILTWLRADAERLAALREARELELSDWWLAAGFVRNLVWDQLHDYAQATPLNDIDLIFFDAEAANPARDAWLTEQLCARSGRPWSVKNQARMHQVHGHRPYSSSAEAMRFWVERETAVAVTLDAHGQLHLAAPLGIESLLAGRVTPNSLNGDREAYSRRVDGKSWSQIWPRLVISEP